MVDRLTMATMTDGSCSSNSCTLQFHGSTCVEQYRNRSRSPQNRLVAAELWRRRWNAKLEEVEQGQGCSSLLDHQRPTLTAADEERIRALGENFADVWNSKDCPGTLKKQMARTVIEEVIASDADETRAFRDSLERRRASN